MIIDGRKLAQKIKDELKKEIQQFDRPPHLAVVLIGGDYSSRVYVRGKERACLEVGITSSVYLLNDTVQKKDVIQLIDNLNNDRDVDAILVQLPIPVSLNSNKIIEMINPCKDVDGFTPQNVCGLYHKTDCVIPCTPLGIIKLIESTGYEIAGKEACVVGRSNIVGLPIAKLLLDRNATVTTAHSKTKNLLEVCKRADIIISATGAPNLIKREFVKEGALVIDVGIYRNADNKLVGDVDFELVREVAGYITKVPGGVGPMTIACLLENTVKLYKRNKQ